MEKIGGSRARAGKVQAEPETLCTRKRSRAQRTMGTCQRDMEVSLKGNGQDPSDHSQTFE